jgi:monoamine oxidase
MSDKSAEKIAIVGGGITGLFCAWILREQGKSVHLFETADRLGGRIRTIRLGKDGKQLPDAWKVDELEFYAEFGPMLLAALLKKLGIKAKAVDEEHRADCHLVDFPSYASPASAHDPQYELQAGEVGKSPLQLLKMGVLRVIAHLEVDEKSALATKKGELVQQISLAAALQEPIEPIFDQWVKELDGDDHWQIQTRGRIGDVPLYALGFWNLMSDYLSHNAILKLRDLGTFYHLLPENPNAAEWLTWWLIGFSISEKLQGIFGGMQGIVDRLVDSLGESLLSRKCWVTAIGRNETTSKLKLVFHPTKSPEQGLADQEYDRVILAVPRRALQDIQRRSGEVFESEQEIQGLLESAFGFPMVKAFVVVKDRWWEEKNMANRFATRMPTRELHYWKGLTKDSNQGLIMLYTDRPASSFWANYVPSGAQIDVHGAGDHPRKASPAGADAPSGAQIDVHGAWAKQLPDTLRKRLLAKIAQYLSETHLPDITPEDLGWYGIRDWGRAPYGGANHAWRPERKYWVVMRRLADIAASAQGATGPSLHICGEAYSDYHGFIEGSLRSAVYALHRILDQNHDGTFKPLPWLDGLGVDLTYRAELCAWAQRLDEVDPLEDYVISYGKVPAGSS